MAANPNTPTLVIKVGTGRIIFYSQYKYKELNAAVKPGRWDNEVKPLEEGGRPGAWVYPVEAEVAAKLLQEFMPVIRQLKRVEIDPKFYELAKAGADSLRLKLTLDPENREIVLHFPYSEYMVSLIKRIPGRAWRNEFKYWTIPYQSAGQFLQIFRQEAAREWDNAVIPSEFYQLPAIRQEAAASAVLEEFKSKTPMWKHQSEGLSRALQRPGFALLWEMGGGKSKTAVDYAVNAGCRRILIFGPKSALAVWPKQFRLHAAEEYRVLVLDDNKNLADKTARAGRFIRECEAEKAPFAICINYESAWREPFADFALRADFDLVIADEMHKIKAAGSKVSRYCARLGQRVNRRLGLTGTPITDRPIDIYGQMRFIDPGIFGTSFAAFEQQYCITDQFGNPIGYRNLPELNAKLFSAAHRVLCKDVQELPDQVHNEVTFKLDSEGQRIYNEMEKTGMADIIAAVAAARAGEAVDPEALEVWESMVEAAGIEIPAYDPENRIKVKNALNISMKLMQITGGWTKNEEGQYKNVSQAKAEALEDLIEGLPANEPLIIFAVFIKELETIHAVCAKLGRASLELSGSKNELAKWQAGEAPVIVVNVQAGGAGIDLTGQDLPNGQRIPAHYVIYYSAGFRYGDLEQSIKRAHRPGQTEKVFYYWLRAENSIDIHAAKAVEKKRMAASTVLDRSTADLLAEEAAKLARLAEQAAAGSVTAGAALETI